MSEVCRHADIEISWSNVRDPSDVASLPYGHAILQRGSCFACGATLERRRRVDGWTPWLDDTGDVSDEAAGV